MTKLMGCLQYKFNLILCQEVEKMKGAELCQVKSGQKIGRDLTKIACFTNLKNTTWKQQSTIKELYWSSINQEMQTTKSKDKL